MRPATIAQFVKIAWPGKSVWAWQMVERSLFSDNFDRTSPPPPTPLPFTWTTFGSYGVFNTNSGTLNTSTSASNQYGYAYKNVPARTGRKLHH